ncbi:PaaI family thioesterase [Nocardia arthritidis]|uniref:Hotdog fold thioesterase n=1 Tax=Nocardia arthritidis TaxID=228602 RepID=A0A6G9YGR3_9NOCA|nr:PaaI family thioesterase [Nocardia arthritidis]QIS12388.1 hotdog fold thioesterase [Nocardia arthritidis]
MSDDATIRGHDRIAEHITPIFRGIPTPPGVDLALPPPSMKTLGLRFEEYVPAQSLTATVTVSEEFGNVVGMLQGGLLSAMLDDVIGALSFLTARGLTTSLELTTHFLRPVRLGERLRLTAVVRKAGRTAIYVSAEAHNADGKLVATAMSAQHVVSMPTP